MRPRAFLGALGLLWPILSSGAPGSAAGQSTAGQRAAEPPAEVKPKEIGESLDRLQGLAIGRIEIVAAPQEAQTELLALTGLVAGAPFVASEVRRAVKVLYQLGRFENVYVNAARAGDGVDLELVLPPRPRVREIQITSGGFLSRSEIEDAIELRAGAELDLGALSAKRARVAQALRRVGYLSPAIGIAADRVDQNGNHDVILRIDEGPRTHLRQIRFEGRPKRTYFSLIATLDIQPGDVLELNRVERAIARLKADYRKRGFFEVSIAPPVVQDTRQVVGGEPLSDLVITIDAGPRIKVQFRGNAALSIRELEEAATIMAETDVGAGTSAIAEVRERILARYERRGYWQAEVRPKIATSKGGGRKRIIFEIREGNESYVASRQFPGNSVFPQKDLEDKLDEAVEATLAEELGRPGTNPPTLDQIIGDGSGPRRNRGVEPDQTSPNFHQIYVERAYRAATEAIADLYRGIGYQSVEVKAPIVTPRKDPRLVDVSIEVKQGVRWMLGALSFSGNESVGSNVLLETARLDPTRPDGEPLSFYKVDEASRAILTHYRNNGYLYARVSEDLREAPQRGSLARADYVRTSSSAPLDIRGICQKAEQDGKPTCAIELVFRVVEGPLVHTRSLVIRGVESTSESLVRGEIVIHEGDILRESDMETTRANLQRLGVFERISVRPIDEQREAAEKDVLCELHERKYSSAELGAGASTEEGVRLFAGYGHSNVFGSTLRFQTNAKVNIQPFIFFYPVTFRDNISKFYSKISPGQQIQRLLSAGLSAPQVIGLPRGIGAGVDLSYRLHLEPAYLEEGFSVTVGANYKGFHPVILGKGRPMSMTVRSNLDYSELGCNRAVLTSTFAQRGNVCSRDSRATTGTSIYVITGPSVRWDLADDPVNPRSGFQIELSGDYASGFTANSPNFFKLEGRLSTYLPLSNRWGFAFAFLAGRIFPLETNTQVPVNRRYFAGGSSTIRGYYEQSLFPQDAPCPEPNPTNRTGCPQKGAISSGGLFLIALRNELRFPILGALYGAFFYDIGDLYTSVTNFSLDFDKTRQGVGLGFRYTTPVGPLSLDFGVPLTKRGDEGEPAFATVHFSVRSF